MGGLDAVTIDAMGTLVRLVDPVPRLAAAAGVSEEAARRGFAAEVAYYVPRSHEGTDAASLADLRGEPSPRRRLRDPGELGEPRARVDELDERPHRV